MNRLTSTRPVRSRWLAIAAFFVGMTWLGANALAASSSTVTWDSWPHVVTGERGTATVYQPQVISWPGSRTLNTRIAVAVTPTGATTASWGTLNVTFTSSTDLANRVVTLTDPQLQSVQFPSLGSDMTTRIQERAKTILAEMGFKQVPLDMVLLSLRHQTDLPAEVALSHSPPRIYVSSRPASLIVFDGEPVMTPVSGTTLTIAVNTNWQIFFEAQTHTWYLLNNGGWLSAPDVKGPWLAVDTLPPVFASLPNDANFAEVKKQIPGRKFADKDVPIIFVSTVPAAIIVTTGSPKYVSIKGTGLQYVSNTDAVLFKYQDGTFYYLNSGRWFSAPGLNGPWTFATANLPADFAQIPPDSPRGFVLVSVPGTPQAQEALIQSQIPQEGTLNKSTASLTVLYAGAPQFVPITGTAMSYAANTSFIVIQAAGSYYSCYQGAWFVAPTPNGPWALTGTVPAIIYTIPPTCPVYPCTYVQVYAETPTTVTFGYTAGYTLSYVSAGVVVYGTGYYYPPYYYPAPIPIYYPYPYSYAGATYYNPTTGAWAHGGAIYGPYGGVAKGGTAYNPTTGAWAQGGAIYGPYGGAGAFSAYNPTTGSYAHGSAVWGPDGASGNASWFNANTGRSGTTQQNSNAYGRWGSSTISGPNQTVHTQSQSDSRGSAGSFSSSTGAKGAGVSGAGGNSAGVVKGAGGDVYAGADGNVYKKTDDGWEKYNDGSWNSVQPPSKQNSSADNLTGSSAASSGFRAARDSSPTTDDLARPSNQGNLSGATERTSRFGSSGGFDGWGQLEQDRAARWGGAQRQQQFESSRGNFGGRAAGGFGRGGFRR